MDIATLTKELETIVRLADEKLQSFKEKLDLNPANTIAWYAEEVSMYAIQKQHATRFLKYINNNPTANEEDVINAITEDVNNMIFRFTPEDTSGMGHRLVNNYATPKAHYNLRKTVSGLFF